VPTKRFEVFFSETPRLGDIKVRQESGDVGQNTMPILADIRRDLKRKSCSFTFVTPNMRRETLP
jgi:hypothetical protein